ncbi:alkaline phosphatase PafA [Paraflavisolibacter sp. H34]|uniref:alkaline phosphatase PafA n=1 Tax=Huijunlia imazamoxiresistens TaxID=3127457 RepID=UPI00301A6BD7
MKKLLFSLLFFAFIGANAQSLSRPKLVVGIVVDQMRWDFLYRYYDRYGKDGFKRLLNRGFSCENTFIPYTPTVTAVGHSSVYTGSVPSLHGIMANNWYDRQLKKSVYCTDDTTVRGVGTTSSAGRMSPRRLWATTITDELRMATNFTNKTIAVALKDRGCILPGGHTANAAYWFDQDQGNFITSTYYLDTLPAWVRQFNDRKLPDTYLSQNWNLLYPANTYTQSTPDDRPYEGKVPDGKGSFPHLTSQVTHDKYEAFWFSPFGNTVTLEMAKAAVEGEQLGKGKATDFLAVSISSTDALGHQYGPNSVELEDTYLRLDKDLGAFLKFLDDKVGKGDYLLFLTADHAVAHVPAWSQEHKIPAGGTSAANVRQQLNDALRQRYNQANLIEVVSGSQVYLNDSVLQQSGLDRREVKRQVIQALLRIPAVSKAVDLEDLPSAGLPEKVRLMLTNGYNQKLSGDIQFVNKPQWFEVGVTGTGHGAWNPYDSHIPLVWYGWNIRQGKTNRETYMTDIAATLAALLRIQMPNACIGTVIEEVSR